MDSAVVKTSSTFVSPKARLQRLTPVELQVNTYLLSPTERVVVKYLAEAADSIDAIFWAQSCPNADEFRRQFAADFAADSWLSQYFEINYGPYDRLAGNEPFLPVGPKPPGAGFYPPGLTKKAFLDFASQHEAEEEKFLSSYTIIRQDQDGLHAVPYHEVYADQLAKVVAALLQAASHETREVYRQYFRSRAQALQTDDYYESDLQWIDLPREGIDLVIGPYEVYEDELMGVKAAYEAMITVQDSKEAERVQSFVKEIGEFHNHMVSRVGIDFDPPGPSTPLVVADLLYSTGDARKGIPSIAFTLPNDERVIQEKGTKEVILRNLLQAKFQHVLEPISSVIYRKNFDSGQVFEGYLYHTILHEISHALGPHRIRVNGEDTTVNRSLGELYTTLEEAKADVLAACWLLWKGGAVRSHELSPLLVAYLPELIRAMRFGQSQAHGRANLLQLNYLVAHGVIQMTADGVPRISAELLEEGLLSLAGTILKIQAEGDYPAAERLSQKYCQNTPETLSLLKQLERLPIDIVVSFSGLHEC